MQTARNANCGSRKSRISEMLLTQLNGGAYLSKKKIKLENEETKEVNSGVTGGSILEPIL